MATARERSSSSESLEEPSPLPGEGPQGKGEPGEKTVDSFLLRQQRERMFELRRISHGDRPVSGQGFREKLDAFFRNHVGADSTELSEGDEQNRPTSSQGRTEERRPEAVRLEVRGLFDQHRVSNVLQSDLFRRELESVVRGGLSRFHRSVPPPPLPPPPPQDFNDASSTATDIDETGSVSSFTSGSTSDVSLHSWLWQVPPPPPPAASQQWMGPPQMGPPQMGNGAYPPPPSYQAAQHAQLPWQQQQQAPGQQSAWQQQQQQQVPWQQGPWQQQQQQGPSQQQQGPWQQGQQGPWQQQQGPWQQQQGPWQQQQGPWQQGPWQQTHQGPWQQGQQGPLQQQQQAQQGHRQQPWLQRRQPTPLLRQQQQQANRRTLFDIEQAQRENIVSDISELLQRQLVSSSLDGRFRGVLELMVARRVNETGTDGERVQESIQNIPRSRPHRRNDFSHLGINTQPEGAEADGTGTAGIQGPEMQSLKAEIEELKNMVRVSFDLQLDLQRAIRQEVAAAMAAHTGHRPKNGSRTHVHPKNDTQQ